VKCRGPRLWRSESSWIRALTRHFGHPLPPERERVGRGALLTTYRYLPDVSGGISSTRESSAVPDAHSRQQPTRKWLDLTGEFRPAPAAVPATGSSCWINLNGANAGLVAYLVDQRQGMHGIARLRAHEIPCCDEDLLSTGSPHQARARSHPWPCRPAIADERESQVASGHD